MQIPIYIVSSGTFSCYNAGRFISPNQENITHCNTKNVKASAQRYKVCMSSYISCMKTSLTGTVFNFKEVEMETFRPFCV